MDNKFAVKLPSRQQDPTGMYKKYLMDKVINKYPWLNVSGVDSPEYTPSGRYIRGANYAGPNDLITFGTSQFHDVNWVEAKNVSKGITPPIYDIVTEHNAAMQRIAQFAENKNPNKKQKSYSNCCNSFCLGRNKVEVFDNFIKIGYSIIPRVVTPVTYYRITPVEYQLIRTVVTEITITF